MVRKWPKEIRNPMLYPFELRAPEGSTNHPQVAVAVAVDPGTGVKPRALIIRAQANVSQFVL